LTVQACALSVWDAESGESRLEGVLLNCRGNYVQIDTKNGRKTLPLAEDAILALTGSNNGYILTPEEFPPYLSVELIIDRHGKVRALRSKPAIITTPEGQDLGMCGHEATLSPDGSKYLLFHQGSGLYLHSLTQEFAPVFLSAAPQTAWNASGDKIACCYGDIGDKILIYDVLRQKKKLLSLPKLKTGLTRTVFTISWSPDGQKLFYTALEDAPALGSDVFFLRIMDLNGRTLQVKPILNLIAVYWQTDRRILLVRAGDNDQQSCGVLLWDTKSDEEELLAPFLPGYGGSAAYNPAANVLAYTTASSAGFGEDLHLLDLSAGNSVRILTQTAPVRNLQWSKNRTLLFYEALNNLIYAVVRDDRHDRYALSARVAGYLPAFGSHRSQESFLYFAAEPFEEPQPLFLSSPPSILQAGAGND